MKRIREQLRANASGRPIPAKPSMAGESSARILERIKQRLQTAAPAATVPGGTSRAASDSGISSPAPAPFTLKLHETSQLRTEIYTALEGTRLVGQINPRNPGLINNLIQMLKKVMRRSLTWYTRPLHYFQGGVVRALEQIAAILDNHNDSLRKLVTELRLGADWAGAVEQKTARLEQRTGSLEETTASLEHRLEEEAKLFEVKLRDASLAHEGRIAAAMAAQGAALTAATSPVSGEISRLSGELEALRSELVKTRGEIRDANASGRVRDRDVRRTLYALQNGPVTSGDSQCPTPPMFASEIKSDKEFDYFAFEDLYRGEEADIRSRQQEYLEYFRGRENVVDIGCGRGEFLELLRDNNISAHGVELGLDQYLLCREKGLDVVQQDLFEFLESLSDESLGGLFSAQVIEHLTASDQLRYVALAHRKTMPGSPVIFETINAQCVYAVMRNFFLDPTHVRPVHPETLKFAMESMQFKNVELRFSGPVTDKQIPPLKLNGDTPQLAEFNRSMQELNNLIYGYQDYAAIGWR